MNVLHQNWPDWYQIRTTSNHSNDQIMVKNLWMVDFSNKSYEKSLSARPVWAGPINGSAKDNFFHCVVKMSDFQKLFRTLSSNHGFGSFMEAELFDLH